jgi:hypothetical protein
MMRFRSLELSVRGGVLHGAQANVNAWALAFD